VTAVADLTGGGLERSLDADTVEDRARRAALTCIARHGVGKTTIDDVAREAGCSRATLYRYFGGKAQLVAGAVHSEVERITAAVWEAALATDTLEDALVAVLATAGAEISDHPALRFVVAFEPERLLPHLAFGAGDRVLAAAAAAIEPVLTRFAGDRAPRAAEWVARVGLVLWLCPDAPLSLRDPVALRDYVRTFILPAIDPASIPSLRKG
jgi:AcrR family transcriptional regulator